MSSDRPGTPVSLTTRPRRAGRIGRQLLAVVVVLGVALAGYGTYSYVTHRPAPGTTDLVVYTYASLFGGSCGSPALSDVLAPFEAARHVSITLVCPSGTLVSTLLSERSSPAADVVIGLDEITTPQAVENGLLVPYASPSLSNVPAALLAEVDPGHHVTPYEWGYLAIDYTSAFANRTNGAIAHSSFLDFASNSTWAKGLILEDPAGDITGEELLLWQIEFYAQVLHADWTSWWKQVAPYVHTAPDWGSAFAQFSGSTDPTSTVVSYTTDAAYAAANGAPGSIGTAVTTWNGTQYGWRTVYGAGIVNGSAHQDLDRALLDWLLDGHVQSQIPQNEWEYPANSTTPLPDSFAAAPSPTTIVPLNDGTTPSALAAALGGYLDTWQQLMNQYG